MHAGVDRFGSVRGLKKWERSKGKGTQTAQRRREEVSNSLGRKTQEESEFVPTLASWISSN